MAIITETGAADDDDDGGDDDDGDDDKHENMGAMGYADDWWSTVAADDDVEDEIVDKSVQANMARGSSKSTSGMILQPLRVENGGAETTWNRLSRTSSNNMESLAPKFYTEEEAETEATKQEKRGGSGLLRETLRAGRQALSLFARPFFPWE